MMKTFFKALCAVSVGMVMFGSCQEKITDEAVGEKVYFDVSVSSVETKLTGSVNEATISNYQVFLYNDAGVLEAYVRKTTSDLSLECTVGIKTIVVLANAPSMTDCSTLSTLLAKTSSLKDNSAGAFVMVGKISQTISKTTTSVPVQVTRLVSKVRLSKLEVAFEMPQYQSQTFKVSSVYLINVPADRNYFTSSTASTWFHKSKYISSDACSLIYDDMKGVTVSSTAPYTSQNTFYCYPNTTESDSFSTTWSARHTRLVVEATLGSTTYYYPVTLPVMASNKIYDVNLKITRPGATKPDAEVDKFAAGFTVSVKDWETGTTVSEEI